ncbi:uncharacterized protein LOC133927538 [Phragmites australis]|uniref:uncharacterized protein LOC133927538 n=1 Tax=Phragmites australis TaxID=29695 RepID=UPI002D773514|nr:uncharacterized protein LOC133927538 [Phragmites australis]
MAGPSLTKGPYTPFLFFLPHPPSQTLANPVLSSVPPLSFPGVVAPPALDFPLQHQSIEKNQQNGITGRRRRKDQLPPPPLLLQPLSNPNLMTARAGLKAGRGAQGKVSEFVVVLRLTLEVRRYYRLKVLEACHEGMKM